MSKLSVRRGRGEPVKPLNLASFAKEQQIMSSSPYWATIGNWQRQGLVKLRWGDTRDFAWVSLTERGIAYVAEHMQPALLA